MANTHETLTALFSNIADAIREKTGETDTIVADEFPNAIAEILTGVSGIDYGEVTITSATTEITVAHNLKAVPSNVFLIPLNNFFDGVMSNYRYIFNGKINNIVPSITKSVSDSIAPDNLEKANILTDTEITFTYNFTFGAYGTSEFTRNTTFMWFAVV